MIIIIDGYNLLKQVEPTSSPGTKQKFIRELEAYANHKRHNLIIVFDGGDQPYEYHESQSKVRITQSGYKQTADDYIKRLLEQEKGKDLLLVSSDRELIKFAQQLNIESTQSRLFWTLIHSQKTDVSPTHTTALIRKSNPTPNQELEKIMEETTRKIPQKFEDQAPSRKRSGQSFSKQEKKLLKKVKKL